MFIVRVGGINLILIDGKEIILFNIFEINELNNFIFIIGNEYSYIILEQFCDELIGFDQFFGGDSLFQLGNG